MRRTHAVVQMTGAVLVDQVHGAFVDVFFLQEIIGGVGDDVDDGIADGGQLETGGG